MKRSDIAELLDEPACEHNQGEKSGCARPVPGATAGGCSFDGAQISLLPIADVAHIVHGPIACAGNSWNNRGTRASGRNLFRLGFTTDLNEQDVIMGRAEKRLLHAIKTVIEKHQPPAVFVYVTCVPALEGNDVHAICKLAQQRWELPVVAVDAAGFYGSKNLGNRIAGEVMVKQVVGSAEPPAKPLMRHDPTRQVNDIVLIGEYNIAGEFWHVSPLLERLGYRVLSCMSGDTRFHEIQTMHRADAAMVVCSRAQINVARMLEERWDIPWFEGSFYGVEDTSAALRSFAKLINDPQVIRETEVLIAEQEIAIRKKLQPYINRLTGTKALLYTGGVKSWSIVSALQELGVSVVATGTKKSTAEDKARIKQIMGDEALMLDEGGARNLLDIASQQQADLLIAGGRNMYTALKARLPFLDINQEREHAYAGYEGMLTFAKELCRTLESPIWPLVASTAPWQQKVRLSSEEQ
ncbi:MULTISPECIES: nitrogenase iron-molybdenum cofactor biosynthesis protein NifE [unclassified Agarivorans]|uniref:nitrogenase iron-molybdenum cofactor biosynthesis protein NifE n=1 Tax=unclassified Agarivorans TaxID=2636026 RepID=UPI0026E3F845|nr:MULTISPECIES: nitrogenase iron-molybdenum cofactor biosynthesis protein NifE [unclassified Agarivorans]MDO6685966.1 nitrogenase iron-molybdenum cofactor biosynthesis protein NifE [Agarivorans sp. 3_MG-2023]MDO6713896.1 nitrogenase iron-molybdenum cofactor biosynthesis protein NifE [Agarivorans sp. 2_MG-2023]